MTASKICMVRIFKSFGA